MIGGFEGAKSFSLQLRWERLYIMSSAVAQKKNSEVKKRTTEGDVLAYLKRRPDFFMKHSDVLDNLKLKRTEGNVTSINTVRAHRKEQEADTLKLKQQRLINTAALNADTANTIFTCVLDLSAATTLAKVRTLVQTTFRHELDLDATRLFLLGETDTATTLTEDTIAILTAENAAMPRTLYDVTDRDIYGTTGKLMKSDLLLRLEHDGQIFGLLALASKDETRFHSGQSFELATFLGAVLATTLARIS